MCTQQEALAAREEPRACKRQGDTAVLRRGRDMPGDVPLGAGMSFSISISHHQCLLQQEAAQGIPPALVGAAS